MAPPYIVVFLSPLSWISGRICPQPRHFITYFWKLCDIISRLWFWIISRLWLKEFFRKSPLAFNLLSTKLSVFTALVSFYLERFTYNMENSNNGLWNDLKKNLQTKIQWIWSYNVRLNSDAANVRTKNPTQKLVSEQITRKNNKMASGDMEKSFRHYHSTNQCLKIIFFSCDGYLF